MVGGELMFVDGLAWVLDIEYTWEHLYLIAPREEEPSSPKLSLYSSLSPPMPHQARPL